VTSGKSGGGGAYPSGGAAGRREESSGTAAFASGEGAPVFVVECDEVLQLRRGKGVRKLQEIARIGARGGANRGMADGGGAQPESEEGGAFGGQRRWSRCGERWGKVWRSRGGQRGVGDGGADGRSGTF
jgi:hypothetical protein